MKKALCILSLFVMLFSKSISAQKDSLDDDIIICPVEIVAEFPGGQKALYKYISDSLDLPDNQCMGLNGKIYVKFLVSETGKVEDVIIVRGLREDIDKKVVHVIKNMPGWKPGMQRGKAVKNWMILPIKISTL